MSGKPSNRLAVALFRTMLKWSRSNADVPFSLRTGDLAVLAPTLRRQRSNTNTSGASALAAPLFSTSASLLQHYAEMGAAAVPLIARAEYDACRTAAARSDEEQAEATAAALDRGLECVRLLHTVYHQQLTTMRDMRQDRSDKTGVKFAVGQTFIHKKYGYRGVVYGWDRQCQRDDDWLKAMNVTNPNQPFYYCLPDETDCTRLFGGVRITKYCAQDNIQAISDTRIVHRALDAHFVAYSPTLSRYIPVKKTQYEYPDQYEAEDAAPVGDDANLLAQPEVEPSPATRLRSGRSKGRGFVSVKA